jgi:hypothetical protein
VETGEIAKDLEGHRDLVRTLVIKPELERLVSGSYDQDVRVRPILSSHSSTRPDRLRLPDLGLEDE